MKALPTSTLTSGVAGGGAVCLGGEPSEERLPAAWAPGHPQLLHEASAQWSRQHCSFAPPLCAPVPCPAALAHHLLGNRAPDSQGKLANPKVTTWLILQAAVISLCAPFCRFYLPNSCQSSSSILRVLLRPRKLLRTVELY